MKAEVLFCTSFKDPDTERWDYMKFISAKMHFILIQDTFSQMIAGTCGSASFEMYKPVHMSKLEVVFTGMSTSYTV